MPSCLWKGFSSSRSCPARGTPSQSRTARRPRMRPELEALESRLLAATDVWSGLSTSTNHWSDSQNWQGGIVPSPNDDLVFPGGAQLPQNFNDLSGGGPAGAALF